MPGHMINMILNLYHDICTRSFAELYYCNSTSQNSYVYRSTNPKHKTKSAVSYIVPVFLFCFSFVLNDYRGFFVSFFVCLFVRCFARKKQRGGEENDKIKN